ncbi:hypothetical protein BOTBODRAFT_179126 [Botryobasidium botryosum FD-172 SS1]|uniref:D-isomer specific 2-hydroxyacid dehydrogenase NAD-binding domain-containing protein n=1 Tax=Botryobasidium botryosum (strain FD-172 SS1) TaxID=930990 RepID=A0A067M3I0_BOTB1|nr:hypothetical protein BOTBODRAFT_179126 [Botryobasidium botryosum FD-172 SS1]
MASVPIKTAILDDYQHAALKCADWSSIAPRLAIDVYDDTIHDEDAIIKCLEPYTIICAMRERTKFPRSVLERLPNLKLLATTYMRNQGIDVAAANERGVIVCGTHGKGDPTTEHNWALLMAVARHIPVEHANIQAGNKTWQSTVPVGLHGRTIGLVGLGNLGKGTAKIAQAFNMRVVAWSPNLTPERAEEAGVAFAATKEELMKQSDFVSIHMVLVDSTRGLIGAPELAAMKPTAYFVNTSRGPIVDEDALVSALKEKKIAGAALDVYGVEPLPLDHPLRTLDNVVLSPHLGYVSDDNYKVFWEHTVENIAAFLDGVPQPRLMRPL